MIERQILSRILSDEDYSRQVLPFLQEDYFREESDRCVLTLIQNYLNKYNTLPSVKALEIDLGNLDNLSQRTFDEAEAILKEIAVPSNGDREWLLDETEKFCQDKALYNAIMESIRVIEDKDAKGVSRGAIPKMLSDALGVSFDNAIGHDYLEDSDERFDFYHRVEERIPFNLSMFNKITKGGIPKKTLNVILAGTGVGKTLAMCDFAANYMKAGKNVLYITMEMAEERISQRIDANLLDATLDEIEAMPKETFRKKVARVKENTVGRLKIKEFPTSGANANHFRHLLNELKIKQNFIPDVIFIDYINICSSARIKMGATINSYTFIKAIAEELRGLATEFNVPIWTATQTTRSGFGNTDVGLEDTAESFGLPATADFMFALITSEELAALGQLMVKQLKNRYTDVNHNAKFVVGIDRSKFRLYDVEESAQHDIVSNTDRQSSRESRPLNRFGTERKPEFKGKGISMD